MSAPLLEVKDLCMRFGGLLAVDHVAFDVKPQEVFAIIGPGYDKTNALLSPPAPLTVKNKLDMFSPVKDAELMDFGFIQSDFF